MQENVNIPDSNITANLTFRNLVLMNMQQLTNFPYIEKDFDALTDYELLCLVVKFLNDVIANQNEQNDSITSMYNAFLALQSYVNDTKDTLETAFNNLDDYVRNFFENLDLQEEVNIKLDQMLEDGVLEQIIEQFLQSTAIWCFDTVADMKTATNLINGSDAKTLGYYSINDGGGALYHITNSESLTEYQEELNSGLYATLLIENDTLNIKQLGAKGNGTDNDASFIQNAVNLTPNIVYIPKGNYLINETITINKAVHIKGDGVNGVSDYLNSGNTNILYSGTQKAFDCTATAHSFVRLIIEGITIKSINENHQGYGILIHDFNHFLLNNVTVCEFRAGCGIQVGNNNAFGCQYGSIKSCIIGMCFIGIRVYQSNGINIEDCYIDGNNNGSDINQYTHGYPDNSIGINFVSGDTNKSYGNRIQGFQTGIKVDGNLNDIALTRCEMCYKGFIINGNNNTIQDGCTNVNYLLLEKNGLPTSGRYGNVAEITGNRNVIGKLQYGSCVGPTNSGAYNEIGERIVIYLPEISDTINLKAQISPYLQAHSCRINSFAFKASNLADAKAAGYANRWLISTQSAYVETQDIPDASLNSLITIATNKQDVLTEIPVNFVKNGSAVTLKNVEVIIDLLEW